MDPSEGEPDVEILKEKLRRAQAELAQVRRELNSRGGDVSDIRTSRAGERFEWIEVTENLDHLLTSTEIGVIFLDREFRIRKFTESVKVILNLTDEIVGREIGTLLDRFDDQAFRELLTELKSGRDVVEREVSVDNGDCYLLRMLPYSKIADIASEDLQVVVTIVDITSAKHAERTQARLARLIDQSSDCIVSTDGTGTIETWNRGAELMLGVSSEIAVGRPLADVFKEQVVECPFEDFFQFPLEDRQLDLTTWTIRQPDGHVQLVIDWRAVVQRDSDGNVQAVSFIARDVSEIAEANRRVAASEHELRRLMETVTEAIVVLDADWKCIFANEGMCRMAETNLNLLLGRSIWKILPKTAETDFKKMLFESMEQGESKRFEQFSDSTGRWYQCHCFPSNDRMTVFFTDITDLRLSNDLLRQQAEMLELSHDAILAWDLEGGIRYWNRGAELLYGYSREEVIGRSSHEVLRTEHPTPLEEILDVIRQRGDWEGRLIQQSRNGQQLQIASRQQLIKSAVDGRQIVLEINRDMTEYDDLTKRVAQLASIVDLTTDFVGTATAGGEILYVNRGAAHLLGYQSPDDLRGMKIEDVHPDEVLANLFSRVLPAAASGEVPQFESELLSKNGDRIPISQVVMAHQDSNGTVSHYSTIARDISARKVYELELQTMRDAAESANRAKSAFLAQMSHEIRTPMTAILGCGEQLQDSVVSEENKQLSRVMVEQGHALMSIMDDILDLSRIEAEKMELEFRPVDVVKVLRDLHRLMTPRAEETGLEFSLTLQGEFPKRINTDPVRLRQILVNLLSNAFKFTPSGSVKLSAICHHATDGSVLEITVADSGVGIPSEDLRTIFEAFARLQNPKANAAGTGLGLTIAHRLTERLGGDLDVESVEGIGTKFFVRFPVPNTRETEYVSAEAPSSVQGSLLGSRSNKAVEKKLPVHVLVAEDTEPIRFLLRTILSPVVEQLTIVENGQQAVEQTRADDSISIVLMDMQMPVMSGLEATQRIRAQRSRLPIVALTAGAMDADRTKCIEAGCSEFLSKPINKRQLLDLIEELCDSGD